MKKSIIVLSLAFILFNICSCTASTKDSEPVVGKDYEVRILIDTVLIFDPETGKEVVKIHEDRDTVWLNRNQSKNKFLKDGKL